MKSKKKILNFENNFKSDNNFKGNRSRKYIESWTVVNNTTPKMHLLLLLLLLCL